MTAIWLIIDAAVDSRHFAIPTSFYPRGDLSLLTFGL